MTNISLILRGSLGRNLMIFGKIRMMERVAAKVSRKPESKRFKGLWRRRMKAAMEMVLIRLTFLQISFPKRKARDMIAALTTEALPSTRKE